MENIEKLQWNSTNIAFLSEDVNKIYYEYKEKIENIIHNNYWLKAEEKILEMFRNIWLEISSRNNDLLKLLEEKYNLNFLENLDFSWGLKISKTLIEELEDEDIKKIFLWDYVREESWYYFSRGYWYYFNFEWFNNDGWINYVLDPELYFNNLEKYFNDIKNSLKAFDWRELSSFNESEKQIFLILLDHYKNILYFFENFLILSSNQEQLSKHVWNVNIKNFKRYYEQWELKDIDTYINNISIELEKVVFVYSDLLLNIDNSNKFNIWETFNSEIYKYWSNFFKNSFDKQKWIISDLENKEKNWKKTDIDWTKKFITKSNNKFIWNLLRIIREEDNPIKQLFASYNIASFIPSDIQNIDINWMLYWWIEMPYFMKYVLERFYNKNEDSLNINLIWMSAYHNRNLKRVSNADNYSELQKSQDKKLQLVLDDNLFYWSTLQVWWNNLMDRWPVLSWVTEIWLRRWKLWKIEEWKSLNFLLSKINGASSVTPIEKNAKWWSYKNMVNKYIKKKLPNLVWKF